jgi:hypothetical protein
MWVLDQLKKGNKATLEKNKKKILILLKKLLEGHSIEITPSRTISLMEKNRN